MLRPHADTIEAQRATCTRAKEWRALLRRQPPISRQIVTRLLGDNSFDRRPNKRWSPLYGVPTGIRTRVSALKGPRPRPLDDGDNSRSGTRNHITRLAPQLAAGHRAR